MQKSVNGVYFLPGRCLEDTKESKSNFLPGFLARNTKCVLRVSSSGNAILDHSFCCMPWGVNQIRLLICIIALLHLFSPLFCYSLFKFHLILKSCIRTIFHFFDEHCAAFLTISDHIAYLKLFSLILQEI